MTDPRYPQPQYPPQPGFGPPPPRKRRVWPWILLAVILLMFGGCGAIIISASHSVSNAVHAGDASTTPMSSGHTAPVGTAVRDGKFQFQVTAVDPPQPSVGTNEFLRKTAQGEFVLIHVMITNIGTAAQDYAETGQKLIDVAGRQYSADTGADMNVNQDLVPTINPGNHLAVALAFDVPQGTDVAAMEFHDSVFSGGASVALK